MPRPMKEITLKRSHLRGALALSFASALVVTAVPAYAASAPSYEPVEEGHLGSVGIDESLPDGTTPVASDTVKSLAEGTLDIDTNLAITDVVMADRDRAINTVTWDQGTDTVHFWAYGDSAGLEKQIDQALPADQAWAVNESVRPIAELEQTIMAIAENPAALPEGMTFVSGSPTEDGSSITIGVETVGGTTLRSAAVPKQIEGVDVQFVEDEYATLSSRSRSSAPLISGGQTWRGAGVGTCTQGFPVFRLQDSAQNSLTADHCTAAGNENWTWGGGSISIGKSTAQAPGDTDLELYTEAGTLSAWMLVGSYNDSSTVAPIRGYLSPVGGNSVCYNGSRSGIVCSNPVDNADTYSCISGGFLQCYWTRWSTQSSGIPAAGNGDSGGPVAVFGIRESDQTVGAYGMGVISMISGAGTTCTGDPSTSTRKCSANAGFAPLHRWASAQSTHNLVYTTS